MSDQRLRNLYAAALAAGQVPNAGTHPSPQALAALARREGPEPDRLATLDHVMSCADCRPDFDLLRAIEGAGDDGAAAGRAGMRRRWLMPAALAASLLLAVGVGRSLLQSHADTSRGDGDAVSLIRPGLEAVEGDSLAFAWHPVPGARRYELELLDAAGAVAASAATGDTTTALTPSPSLPPGDYRWWVRARTSDARTLRSSLRPLRLKPRSPAARRTATTPAASHATGTDGLGSRNGIRTSGSPTTVNPAHSAATSITSPCSPSSPSSTAASTSASPRTTRPPPRSGTPAPARRSG